MPESLKKYYLAQSLNEMSEQMGKENILCRVIIANQVKASFQMEEGNAEMGMGRSRI